MSKKEKLIRRLKSRPKDFTFEEMQTLLEMLGYTMDNKGKTSGSRVKFTKNSDIVILHKPHPGNIIPEYQIRQIIEKLGKVGLI